MDKKIITVTSPLLPNLDDFHAELQKIWDSKWITNNGDYHKKLEAALAEGDIEAAQALKKDLDKTDKKIEKTKHNMREKEQAQMQK